jgi:ATP-dependent DNA ligase
LRTAAYHAGRSENWIKVRCLKAPNFPVIGYVPAKPNSIAADRLARREPALSSVVACSARESRSDPY